jgi:hypothetical protein
MGVASRMILRNTYLDKLPFVLYKRTMKGVLVCRDIRYMVLLDGE